MLASWKKSYDKPSEVKVQSLSRVQLFVTPWSVAYQAFPFMGPSRQENWSGLPFPSLGTFPTQQSNPVISCIAGRCLPSEPPGKPMTNLDSLLKSRDITIPTKVCLVKAMVFPIVMYGCESYTIKKAGHRRTEEQLWCWRRLLKVFWPARRSNKSILKEINPEYSLEGLLLKLKLQYFGHLIWEADLLEKTLMLGKIEAREGAGREQDSWMASPAQWTWVWANSGKVLRIRKPGGLQSMELPRVRHDWVTE